MSKLHQKFINHCLSESIPPTDDAWGCFIDGYHTNEAERLVLETKITVALNALKVARWYITSNSGGFRHTEVLEEMNKAFVCLQKEEE
jgi:hypothetical protein